ncbi:MAG TPA: FAD-binding protein [Chitinophagales bacterium]|nr:FAD-binding protein [Chitinophagales bacterium]
MQDIVEIVVSPAELNHTEAIEKALHKKCGFKPAYWKIHKRSIDARGKNPVFRLQMQLSDVPIIHQPSLPPAFASVKNLPTCIIIGAGPAGLFAALECIRQGIKPVIFERGKNVRARRHDLAKINRAGVVDPDSNYCFGEGGAGTYSDGKLYTRSDKRGNIRAILETFVQFGASSDILVDAHPHIGTNRLPKIIEAIRNHILDAGGEICFESRVTDIRTAENAIKGITLANGDQHDADHVILATGHSARDIFTLLDAKGILIEAKPFALGVRIEHPQHIIDTMQYHCATRGPYLPPSSYSFVEQVDGRGVYSFCMCPGGIIAPCATAPGEIVTNGWSPSKRNNPFANSGFVVGISLEDMQQAGFTGQLAGIHFQQQVEQLAYAAAGGNQKAPAQRMVDFVQKKMSTNLPDCSYQPGITAVQLDDVLPPIISKGLRQAFHQIRSKRSPYFTNEAVMVATESRTSSPVRIPRNPETLEHPQIKGLFPCGEGAGYAGGIISAAIDGIRVAEKIKML